MDFLFQIDSMIIVAILFVLSVLILEFGYRVGLRMGRRLDKDDRGVVDGVYAAIVGLVALLVGFTFAMSASRYDARKQLVLAEANALGTAALRCGFLPDPEAQNLRSILLGYTELRLEASRTLLDDDQLKSIEMRSGQFHTSMWAIVEQASRTQARDAAFSLLAASINEVIDAHGKRKSALLNRVPETVWLLLYGSVLLSLFGTGMRCGFAQRRLFSTTSIFTLVICLVLFVIMDLDRPRRGLITVSQAAMEDTRDSIAAMIRGTN